MVTPVRKLLYAALRKAGVTLRPGRGPSDEQYQDALEECVRMLAGWSIDRMDVYTVRIQAFPLGTKKAYTIGKDPTGATTADFDTDRPNQIERASLILTTVDPVLRLPLRILNDQEWQQVRVQDLPNTIPVEIYNDGDYPFSTIYFWGQAPGSTYSFEMYDWKPVQVFQTPGDTVLLPPGYEDAIVLNLTCRLAPTFHTVLSPLVISQAQKAKALIESKNAPVPRLRSDAPKPSGSAGYFDYRSGRTIG